MTRNDKKRLKRIKENNKKDMLGIKNDGIEDVRPPKFNLKLFLITATVFFFLGQVKIY